MSRLVVCLFGRRISIDLLTLLGVVAAVLGALSGPEGFKLLGETWHTRIMVAGLVLTAIRGALVSRHAPPPPDGSPDVAHETPPDGLR